MIEILNTGVGYLLDLAQGLPIAVFITLIAIAIGLPAATALAFASESRVKLVRYFAIGTVEVGRGFPAIVLLYLIYQGLPQAGAVLEPIVAAIIAFAIGAAGYGAEIVRAALRSIPRGQFEGADASGLTPRTRFLYVLLPQLARLSIPPLMNLTIMIFQVTSVAYVASVREVLSRAYFIGSLTFEFMLVFACAGIVYAVVTIPASWAVGRLERRLSWGSTR
jgi:polar amino acid transport system permease protein